MKPRISVLTIGVDDLLLAKAVLRGGTRGYTHHPQLERFRAHPSPRSAINAYLAALHSEAALRGYSFDRSKVGPVRTVELIFVTLGQLGYEWDHLLGKLSVRSPRFFARLRAQGNPACHPLFLPRPGPVASWERRGRTAGGRNG